MNYKKLASEECCYTCLNNKNALKEDAPCNCKCKNREYVTSQESWCGEYEIVYDND